MYYIHINTFILLRRLLTIWHFQFINYFMSLITLNLSSNFKEKNTNKVLRNFVINSYPM